MEDVVVDEDGRLAGFADATHEVEQLLRLLEGEAHGRLVEDDDLRLEQERPHDGQALALAARQSGDRGIGGEHRGREAHRVLHQLLGDASHLAHLEQAESPRECPTHEDVAPQRQLLREGTLLEHGLDAELAGALDREADDLPPREQDLAPVRLMDAGDDLDERGLARPVVAEQPDDLTGIQAKVDPLEHLDAAERLVRPVAAQAGVHRRTAGPTTLASPWVVVTRDLRERPARVQPAPAVMSRRTWIRTLRGSAARPAVR